MIKTALLMILIVLCGYIVFRYVSLIHGIREIVRELQEIQKDLTQNQMLHLPMPDRHLSGLLYTFNCALKSLQAERLEYEKREKDFQKQIENISHDLRSPLTVILGYLKLFRKSPAAQYSDCPELDETLEIVEHKAESMKQLVEEFYDYSRVNAGDFVLKAEPVDISRLLRESLMGNFALLEQAHLTVEAVIPEHPVWVSGGESPVDRILFNLFQNAGRYAHSWLRIAVEEEPAAVFVLFSNDTLLLSREDIPRLFDRFYMQDASRSQSGTGLGLTVAKALAEEMHGSLQAYVMESQEAGEKDALTVCFKLRLPIQDTPPQSRQVHDKEATDEQIASA